MSRHHVMYLSNKGTKRFIESKMKVAISGLPLEFAAVQQNMSEEILKIRFNSWLLILDEKYEGDKNYMSWHTGYGIIYENSISLQRITNTNKLMFI